MEPRIRLIILSNSKGGVFSFTSTLVSTLDPKQYDIAVTFLNQPTKKQTANLPPIKISNLSLNSTKNMRSLLSFFLRNDADLLHLNFASFFPLAFLKKIMFKTPFVLTLHGLPQPALEYSLKSKLLYSVESILVSFAVRYADTVVTISTYTQTLLKERYHSDSVVIYHGFDPSKIKLMDKQKAKKLLGFAATESVVLFVGVLNPYKDPITLLHGFRKILDERPATLIIVGKGDLSNKVQQTIKSLGINKHVSVFEDISPEKLGACYNAADVFVLPSVNEAFGIVLLEAMAYGLPIVASNNGACREVAAEAGLYFKQGDANMLAKKIMIVLQNDSLRQNLSQAGTARVQSAFTVNMVTEHYSELFKKVLSEKRN